MSTLLEIEEAARQLPPSEQAMLVRRLQGNLQTPRRHPQAGGAALGRGKVEWPDFKARIRAIYGDKVSPNMVLEERESSDR
ncbi:MAG TPA: hypothetical protein VGO11_08230 [Chthoniobacteraceae bacterium]|jgi:hypothetical protein|nr:hypothetical protein [Chthoniobacteraceae bacterium]